MRKRKDTPKRKATEKTTERTTGKTAGKTTKGNEEDQCLSQSAFAVSIAAFTDAGKCHISANSNARSKLIQVP